MGTLQQRQMRFMKLLPNALEVSFLLFAAPGRGFLLLSLGHGTEDRGRHQGLECELSLSRAELTREMAAMEARTILARAEQLQLQLLRRRRQAAVHPEI